jgi:hypothetical protein
MVQPFMALRAGIKIFWMPIAVKTSPAVAPAAPFLTARD